MPGYIVETEGIRSVMKVSCSYFFIYSYSFSIQDNDKFVNLKNCICVYMTLLTVHYLRN